MQGIVTIYNEQLKSRAYYISEELFKLCILFFLYYVVTIFTKSRLLNTNTERQLLTIIFTCLLTIRMFAKHFAAIQFDFNEQLVTITTFSVIRGLREWHITFDDFSYYDQERFIKFRDHLYFNRKNREIAGVLKRSLRPEQMADLRKAIKDVEDLYPDED